MHTLNIAFCVNMSIITVIATNLKSVFIVVTIYLFTENCKEKFEEKRMSIMDHHVMIYFIIMPHMLHTRCPRMTAVSDIVPDDNDSVLSDIVPCDNALCASHHVPQNDSASSDIVPDDNDSVLSDIVPHDNAPCASHQVPQNDCHIRYCT